MFRFLSPPGFFEINEIFVPSRSPCPNLLALTLSRFGEVIRRSRHSPLANVQKLSVNTDLASFQRGSSVPTLSSIHPTPSFIMATLHLSVTDWCRQPPPLLCDTHARPVSLDRCTFPLPLNSRDISCFCWGLLSSVGRTAFKSL